MIPKHDTWVVGPEMYAIIMTDWPGCAPPRLLFTAYCNGVRVIKDDAMVPLRIAFMRNGELVGFYNVETGELSWI